MAKARGRPKKAPPDPNKPVDEVDTRQGDDPQVARAINWYSRAFRIDRRKFETIMEGVNPVKVSGRIRYFTLRQFYEAHIRFLSKDSRNADVLDYTQERARLAQMQANKAELEGEVLAGNLLPKEDVVSFYGELVTNAKARLLGIPSKAAAMGEGMTRAELEDFLTDMVNEALHGLAQGEQGDDANEEAKADELANTNTNAVESAAKAEGQRMG